MHGEEIREAARRVIDSGWYLQGKENEAFEQHYAEYIGTDHCIGCANGLDALIWIFRAYIELGVMQPGDEVILPANTYIATHLGITENGLVPVCVEPNSRTLEIDDSLIEQRITSRTKAICIVHLYGRCACTQRILKRMVAALTAKEPVVLAMQPDTVFTRERTSVRWVMQEP